jgi:Flp pilus assembly protein TadG
MVKQVVVERMLKHIRSTTGFVTVELAIGIATLAFGFLAAVSALGVFLTQLNLIDTAHNAARAAARGQQIDLPANVSLTQQLQNGAILIVVKRDLDFWSKAIELTAIAEVIVE